MINVVNTRPVFVFVPRAWMPKQSMQMSCHVAHIIAPLLETLTAGALLETTALVLLDGRPDAFSTVGLVFISVGVLFLETVWVSDCPDFTTMNLGTKRMPSVDASVKKTASEVASRVTAG